MEKIVFLLVFSSFILANNGLTFQNISCTNDYKTYFLSQSQITYFRTPNFPESLYVLTEDSVCNLIFKTVELETFFWIALFNGNTPYIFINSDANRDRFNPYNSNKGFLSYSAISDDIRFSLAGDYTDYPVYVAFEAIIAIYNIQAREHSCPLANETISLEDGKVIPIASDFNTTLSNTTCWWKFQINSNNQRFKIVIQHVNFTKPFSLDLETDGKIIAKFNNTYKQLYPEPYYFESNTGIFTLNFNSVDFYNNGFFAIVSAVNKTFTFPNNQCEEDEESIYYGEQGYSPYDRCESSVFTVPANHQLFIDPKQFFIEENADKVTLTTLKNNNTYLITDRFNYLLTSEAGDSKVEFLSDGSIQQDGFYLELAYMECKCSNSIIIPHCGGNAWTSIHIINDDYYSENYCTNMKCSFNIVHNESCSENYFTLSYTLSGRDELDYTLLYNNGELFANYTTFEGVTAFSTSTNITIEFSSGPASEVTMVPYGSLNWLIKVHYIDTPTFFPTIYLNETIPTYVSWMNDLNINSAITVCSSINDTMELFVNQNVQALSNYSIYYGTDLMNFIMTLDSHLIKSNNENIPRNIILLSQCITLYNYNAKNFWSNDILNAVTFFRLINANTKNCKDTNNVFLTPSYSTAVTFINHAQALSTGDCELILLSGNTGSDDTYISFGNFSTTSQNGPVVFKSALNQREYFRIEPGENALWERLAIFCPSITVTLPKSSDVTFN